MKAAVMVGRASTEMARILNEITSDYDIDPRTRFFAEDFILFLYGEEIDRESILWREDAALAQSYQETSGKLPLAMQQRMSLYLFNIIGRSEKSRRKGLVLTDEEMSDAIFELEVKMSDAREQVSGFQGSLSLHEKTQFRLVDSPPCQLFDKSPMKSTEIVFYIIPAFQSS